MEHEESGEADLPESGEDGQGAEGFLDLVALSKNLTFFLGPPRLG